MPSGHANCPVTLYILATSSHPYDKDPQEPETLAMVPMPSRQATVQQSWAAFRSTVGESYRLGNTALRTEGPRIKFLYDRCSSSVSAPRTEDDPTDARRAGGSTPSHGRTGAKRVSAFETCLGNSA